MVLVGGISSLHDPLVAAVLRGYGLAAVALPTPDHTALVTGRRWMPRGHPSSMYFLVGAVIEWLTRAGNLCSSIHGHSTSPVVLTVGGRYGHHPSDYRAALRSAGFPDVPVIAPSLDRPWPPELNVLLSNFRTPQLACLVLSLFRALVAGDVLVRVGCYLRPRVREPCAVSSVDTVVARTVRTLESLFERRSSPLPAFRSLLRFVSTFLQDPAPRIRVRITGEFFPSITDGVASYSLVRRLEARGAIVEPPAVSEWGQYLLWQLAIAHGRPTRSLQLALRSLYHRYAGAAGLRDSFLLDIADVLALAQPFYPYPHVVHACSAPLEIGTFLAIDRDRLADVVVSIKPFASVPSSSISDAVIHAISRRTRTVFVSIETTGDAEALVDSRLELALDSARRVRYTSVEIPSPIDVELNSFVVTLHESPTEVLS